MFDLIIFDCDGVLVDSELLAREAMQTVYRASGIKVTDAMVDECVGMKQADILALIETRTGRPLPAEQLAQFWPETERVFRERLLPTPGIVPFLEQSGVLRCVASSSHHERIRTSLALTDLARFFADDAIFSSHDVARGKPAPDLVLHAAARMGIVPERCLVIEDSRFGAIGAKAACMTAWGYVGASHLAGTGAEALAAAGADTVIASWDEAGQHLA